MGQAAFEASEQIRDGQQHALDLLIPGLGEWALHDGAEDHADACEVVDEGRADAAQVGGGDGLKDGEELSRDVAFELHVRGSPTVVVGAKEEHA